MKKTLMLLIGLQISAVILLPSCTEEKLGPSTLRLRFSSPADERTLLPSAPEKMKVSKYSVHIVGPNGYDKTFETSSSELEITDIVIGNYSIDVHSLNSNSEKIAAGSTSVWLYRGNNQFTVVLDTLFGQGKLKADFSWNPKQVSDPRIEVELINQNNEKISLDSSIFSIDKINGTYRMGEVSLPSGSYTLHAKIIDNEQIVSGLVEAVRISNNDTTSGNLSFIIGNTSVSMVLGFKNNVSSPISATVTASPESVDKADIPESVTFTITLGELPSGMKSDEISVAWFLEGEKIDGENSLVLTHKPKPGVMRYDALLYHQYKGSIGSITINYTMPYYAE